MTVKKHKNVSWPSIFKNKTFDYIRTSRLSAWMTAAVFFLLGEWYSLRVIPFYESIFALIALGGLLSSTSWINFVFDKELDSFGSYSSKTIPGDLVQINKIFI